MDAKKKWDRMSRIYDLWSAPMEMMGAGKWRPLLFSAIPEGKILEIGVGTGINFKYYPKTNRDYTAVDISPKMIRRARDRAAKIGTAVTIIEMDAEDLRFPDGTFDAVVATCVLCSVPDPAKVLKEARRVLKRDGTVVFLEHMRPGGRILGKLFDVMNIATSRLIGFNVNRRTSDAIRKAGFTIIDERFLLGDIFRMITAKP